METIPQTDLERWWTEYKTTSHPQARDALLLAYVPLVKYVAGRVCVGLPPSVDYDDLVSFGIFGLMDAIDKFEPDRGIKFETYAMTRVRGAMIDGLRSIDWVPRSVRQKAKDLERQVAQLEGQLGRPATDDEICAALKITPEEYHELLHEISSITLTSLDEVWQGDGDDEGKLKYGQMIENVDSDEPSQVVAEAEVRRVLAEAIDQLPERERLVISLYYHDELTLKEIGAVLGVTESRISQIHTKAIVRLRSRLSRIKESLVS